MKHLWIFLVGALLGNALIGQIQIERQVIAATGSATQVGTTYVSATVGETVTATAIDQSGTLILTQGFQQPEDGPATSRAQELGIQLDYQLYPNPTSDLLKVRLETDQPISVNLSWSEPRGRSVGGDRQNLLIQGVWETEFDLSSLSSGLYHLQLTNQDGKILHTFRVQKN